jgi:hypothetical protein
MNRTFWTSSITALLVGFSVAAIFAYNLWSYCCGRCTARAFFTIGIPGGILMGLTGAAAVLLIVLQTRRRAFLARFRCACGNHLDSTWLFCPRCGTSMLS